MPEIFLARIRVRVVDALMDSPRRGHLIIATTDGITDSIDFIDEAGAVSSSLDACRQLPLLVSMDVTPSQFRRFVALHQALLGLIIAQTGDLILSRMIERDSAIEQNWLAQIGEDLFAITRAGRRVLAAITQHGGTHTW